jgi:4-amino-4-deoxy-L-arabinose transferase-like glycosyltransferase
LWLLLFCSPVIYRFVRRALPSLILLAGISFGSLFFRLESLPLTGADEPRYARIAQEMHERRVWITPLLEGKPWLEKPPLYYWIASPLYSLFKSHEATARVGPAVCAFVCALTVFWLGSMLYTRLAGLFGSLILLTSLGFAGFGRSASTDMPFACCLTIALAVLAVALERDIGGKVLFAYGFLGLAVLAKGPVAIVLAAGIGFFLWLLDERGGVFRRWQVIPGLIVTAAVCVPWFWLAFRQNGYAFISTFFINHNLARFITDIHHHSEPVFYYLPALLALFFPWSGWLLLLISQSPLKGLRHWRQWHPGMIFLVGWFLFPVIFFSLSDSKLAGYILPSLPPLALILGVHLSQWIEASVEPPRLRAGMGLHLIFSAAMAIAVPLYFQKEYGGNWKTGLILSIAILTPAFFAFLFGLKGNCGRAFRVTVLQGFVTLIAAVLFAFPVLGAYHSTRGIAHRALELRQAGEPIVTYRFFHHTLHYYTGYQIADELKNIESLHDFVRVHPNSLVVTNIEGMNAITGSENLTSTLLGEQGNFRLLRAAIRDSRFEIRD